MVLIAILVGVLVVAFGVVAWIFYSAKKEALLSEEEAVVPVKDLREFKVIPTENENSVASSSQPGKVSWEEFVTAPTAPQVSAVAAPSGEAVAPVHDERKDVREDEIRQLKEEVKLIREKAVIQAKNAIEVINKLREQVDQLNAEHSRLAQAKAGAEQDGEALKLLRIENVSLQEALEKKQQEVGIIQKEAQEKIAPLQEALEALEKERAAFQSAAENFEQEKSVLISAARDESRAQLEALAAQLSVLREENVALLTRCENVVPAAAAADVSSEELGSLHKATDLLREEKVSLESQIRELEVSVSTQMEKNAFLQYELTKSRAQAMGLERVYENSRTQIEDLARQVNDSRLDNKELKKQAGLLEQSLNDFRRLNNELSKREKLSQFEVERSRGDLRDLERIYGSFSSRLQKAGLEPGSGAEN